MPLRSNAIVYSHAHRTGSRHFATLQVEGNSRIEEGRRDDESTSRIYTKAEIQNLKDKLYDLECRLRYRSPRSNLSEVSPLRSIRYSSAHKHSSRMLPGEHASNAKLLNEKKKAVGKTVVEDSSSFNKKSPRVTIQGRRARGRTNCRSKSRSKSPFLHTSDDEEENEKTLVL